MTPRISSRRRSSSGHGEEKRTHYPGGLGLLITTALLAIILMTGPVMLGSARLWVDLPLLGGVAFLLFVQGVRLVLPSPADARRQIDAIDLCVLLFVGYAITRWLTSPAEYASRIEILDVIGYAGIFLTCRYGMVNRKYALFLVYLLVILGVGESVFGYYLSHHLDWFPFGPGEANQLHYAPRWIGTYGSSNTYGSLLVMAIGAAVALGSFSKLSWPLRIIFFYVTLVMIIGVMYSGSRGSWIALPASLMALVLWGIRRGTLRWWVPVIGSLAFVLISIFLFSLSPVVRDRLEDFGRLVTGGNLKTYNRVELTRDALHIARDYPFFGTGPATFVYIDPRYQDSFLKFKAVLTHDDYLNCLDDYGLVGFGLAMFFVAAVTMKFFRPLDVDHRWQERVVVATGFAAWAALLIHSFVDFNMHTPANARMLFALTGLALGRFKNEPHWGAIPLTGVGRWPGGAVILLSLGYVVLIAKTALGDFAYEAVAAHVDEVPTSESVAGAQRALGYDAANPQALTLLGDIYRSKASRQEKMEDRLDQGQLALEAYQKAYRINPLDDAILAKMGLTFDIMRRYPEAFICYRQAIMMQPQEGEFWYRLGNHYWQRGMLVKAEQAFIMSEYCPHGAQNTWDAEFQLRHSPQMEGVPPAVPGINPLTTLTEDVKPPMLP